MPRPIRRKGSSRPRTQKRDLGTEAAGLVETNRLGRGLATRNTFLAGDRTWRAAGSGGGPHASDHQNAGSDEINVTGLSGLLADDQNPVDHATDHENGGGDEIDVTGLSGLLADEQDPLDHATDHQAGGGDAIQLDNLAPTDDNTDLDATSVAHGLMPKLSGEAGSVFTTAGTWSHLFGFVMPELGWEMDGDVSLGSSTVSLTVHNMRQYGTLDLGTGVLNTLVGSVPTFTVLYCNDELTSTSGTINVLATNATPAVTAGGAGAGGGGSGGSGGEAAGAIYIYARKMTGTGNVVCDSLIAGTAGANATAASSTANGASSTNPAAGSISFWNLGTGVGTRYTVNGASNGGGGSNGTGGSVRSGSGTGWAMTVQASLRDCSAWQHFYGWGYAGSLSAITAAREFHLCGGGGGGAGGRNNGGAQGAGGGGGGPAAPPWPTGIVYDALQDTVVGGAGGAGGSGAGGGGGGGGASGGLIRVRSISISAGWNFKARGSNGGNGGNGNAWGGGGTGGNGGDGGCVMLETLVASSCTVTVTGGTKGAKGNHGASGGTDGSAGLDGRAGVEIRMLMARAA